jgi:hypothetical protein
VVVAAAARVAVVVRVAVAVVVEITCSGRLTQRQVGSAARVRAVAEAT